MPKTCSRAIVAPPQHEIELGIAQKQRDIRVGNTYDLTKTTARVALRCGVCAR